MSWDDVGFVKSSKYRKNVMNMLNNKSLTPTEISLELKAHVSQVTRSLLELEKRGLVRCLTPSLRKGRLYSLTEKGKKSLNKKPER